MQLFDTTANYQQPNEEGYYGEYGGAYIPEMLYGNVEELKNKYLEIMNDPAFQAEFHALLKDYVGRPTPLFLAERLSKEIGATIYLKREDLCHTGARKINNTIGQILLAQRLGKTAAFGFPLIQKIDAENRNTQALILSPTRELCLQITNEIK